MSVKCLSVDCPIGRLVVQIPTLNLIECCVVRLGSLWIDLIDDHTEMTM